MIPLLAILGGIGFSFDSAFATITIDSPEKCMEVFPTADSYFGTNGKLICNIVGDSTIDFTDIITYIPDGTQLMNNARITLVGEIAEDASGGYLHFEPGSNFFNFNHIDNDIVIYFDDEAYTGFLSFMNYPDATIVNNEAIIINSGGFLNEGTIDNNFQFILRDWFSNDGTFDNSEDGIIYLDPGSNFENSILASGSSGTLNNYGTILELGGVMMGAPINDLTIPPAQPQVESVTMTAQMCQDNVGPTGRDGVVTSWIDPILDGYDGTCQITGPWLSAESFDLGDDSLTIIIDDGLILSLKDGLNVFPRGFTMKVNGGALVLDNTQLISTGELEINSGEFVIYDNAEYYNVGTEQTVNIDGQNAPVPAGAGLITIDSNSSVTLEGSLTNSGAIENFGIFDKMCTGSLENIGEGVVFGDITHEIQCDNLQDPTKQTTQNNETELTPQLCEETEGETDRVQWTDDPILPGYAGTCIITGKYDGTDAPGEGLIVSQDVILLLRNAPGGIAEGAMMQVDGALVLENTSLFGNMGLLQVNGYLQIDEDSTFYNIENSQSISFNGERVEVTGAGELIIDPNASVLLEGELKNSGLIENAGTFDINMCSGSIDNIRAATITNVENGVVNEIACNEQQVNNNEIVCGEGTEFFGGECRPIPQRLNPTVDVPEVPAPEVQQTETTIDLIATVTDTYENGVTTLDIKFNKNYVNYEIDVTQGGDRLFKETSHAMGTTATYEIEGQGSTDNPIDVKITSLGIGLPGQEDKWTGPTGVITTVQVVPEFGTIAMMILVVAIVSVVAITSKSRLMTKI